LTLSSGSARPFAMLREFDEQTPSPLPGEAIASPRRTALEWIRFVFTLAILAIALRSLVIAPFNIPSRSMTPTMLVGDYLFVAKWPYGYSRYSFPFAPDFIEGRIGNGRPLRGDIIVFRSPADTETAYVKRVIGLPGDRIQLIGGEVQINGETMARTRIADFRESVREPSDCPAAPGNDIELERAEDGALFCRTPRYRETLPGGRSYATIDAGDSAADTTREYMVPEGQYFLLGDDRDRSADSRFAARPGGGIGFVPEENIIGRALVIFWSTDGSASWANPASWFSAARWDRIGASY